LPGYAAQAPAVPEIIARVAVNQAQSLDAGRIFV
jgi:hypothetical protein